MKRPNDGTCRQWERKETLVEGRREGGEGRSVMKNAAGDKVSHCRELKDGRKKAM